MASENFSKEAKSFSCPKNISFLSLPKNVSIIELDTIRRDIIYLMQNYPIDFKKGNRGGVLLLYDYRRNNRMYLSDQEEEFLYDFMQNISDAKKRQMKEIIIKFSKNPIKEEWGLL